MNHLSNAPSPRVRTAQIEADEAGQRIDNYLLRILKGAPRSLVYRILRKGEVRVNKKRVRPEYRLVAGDLVRIPPVRSDEGKAAAVPGQRDLDRLRGQILWEDKGLLVLDKPAGMAVHGGSGLSYGVIEALRALFPEQHYLELVHRLDRDTSGCLLIAKKRSVLRSLHEVMRGGEADKVYLCLVQGRWDPALSRVVAPLRKSVLQGGERMVRVDPEGKHAETLFEPVRHFTDATLMRVRLLTGRTHQIRVHAAHAGHPLAGDEKYGDAAFNAALRGKGLKRLFLHAESIGFTLPLDGRVIEVSAPLPEELRGFLEHLDN